jgi:hypothetical protein
LMSVSTCGCLRHPRRPGWAPAGRRVQRGEVRARAASPEGAGFFMDSLDPPIRGRRHRATIIVHLRPRQ